MGVNRRGPSQRKSFAKGVVYDLGFPFWGIRRFGHGLADLLDVVRIILYPHSQSLPLDLYSGPRCL